MNVQPLLSIHNDALKTLSTRLLGFLASDTFLSILQTESYLGAVEDDVVAKDEGPFTIATTQDEINNGIPTITSLDKQKQMMILDLLEIINDKLCLLRFFKKRGFQLDATYEALVNHFFWRVRRQIPLILSSPFNRIDKDVQNILSSGAFYLAENWRDSVGRPIAVLDFARFGTSSSTTSWSPQKLHMVGIIWMELLRRFIADMNETFIPQTSLPPVSQITVLIDLDQFAFSHMSMDFIKTLYDLINTHYPTFFAKVLILNYRLLHSGLWGIVKRLLSPEALERIVFLSEPWQIKEHILFPPTSNHPTTMTECMPAFDSESVKSFYHVYGERYYEVGPGRISPRSTTSPRIMPQFAMLLQRLDNMDSNDTLTTHLTSEQDHVMHTNATATPTQQKLKSPSLEALNLAETSFHTESSASSPASSTKSSALYYSYTYSSAPDIDDETISLRSDSTIALGDVARSSKRLEEEELDLFPNEYEEDEDYDEDKRDIDKLFLEAQKRMVLTRSMEQSQSDSNLTLVFSASHSRNASVAPETNTDDNSLNNQLEKIKLRVRTFYTWILMLLSQKHREIRAQIKQIMTSPRVTRYWRNKDARDELFGKIVLAVCLILFFVRKWEGIKRVVGGVKDALVGALVKAF